MRLRYLAAAAVFGVLSIVLACAKAGSGNEILVGEYGSLTGGIATFGISTRDGSQQAFDEINAAGGVLGKKLKLLVEDDQSKPEEVGTIVTKLIKPFLPKYHMWFAPSASGPHTLVRFEGSYGRPGAPEIVLELL